MANETTGATIGARNPQIGFFMGQAGVSIGGIGIGGFNVFLAWDPFGLGVGDYLGTVWQAWGYTSTVLGGGRIKSYKPIPVAKFDRSLKWLSFESKIIKFKVENPGAGGDIVDFTFEVYSQGSSEPIYTASGKQGTPIKVKIKGANLSSSMGYQGVFNSISDTDIYENLMTEDSSLW